MLKYYPPILLSLVLLVLGCSKPISETKLIKPQSDFIRITGRVKSQGDSVTIYWSGTKILAKFKGTELKALLKDEHGADYFNIIIDGEFERYVRLDSAVKKYYTLASGLPDGEHTVELIKRNEWDSGKTWFYGLEVNGEMVALPPANKKVIEFFGDSITAGYAIEDTTGGDSPDSINTNSYNTYGARVARHYQADAYFTVKSGIGVTISWFPLIMPELYNRLDPSDSLSRWDFSKVSPQVVVINLFQNDSWLVLKPDHDSFKQRFGTKAPDKLQIIAAYKDLVSKIRTAYPQAQIICALGSMDGTKEGSPWPGYIQQAVIELNDQKIFTYFFPFTGKEGHPRVVDNDKMAEDLISFIDKTITW